MWENFTDMKELTSVAVSENSVYCGSKGGVFVVSNNGTIIEKFTNINGLLSNDILSLYLDSQRRLWIGASDGSIVIYDVNNKSFKYIYDIKIQLNLINQSAVFNNSEILFLSELDMAFRKFQ